MGPKKISIKQEFQQLVLEAAGEPVEVTTELFKGMLSHPFVGGDPEEIVRYINTHPRDWPGFRAEYTDDYNIPKLSVRYVGTSED